METLAFPLESGGQASVRRYHIWSLW